MYGSCILTGKYMKMVQVSKESNKTLYQSILALKPKLLGQQAMRRLWAKQSFSAKNWDDTGISAKSIHDENYFVSHLFSRPWPSRLGTVAFDKCGFTRKSSAHHVHCLTLSSRRLRASANTPLPFLFCFLWKEPLEAEPSSIYCLSSLFFAQSLWLSFRVNCEEFSSCDCTDSIWFSVIERLHPEHRHVMPHPAVFMSSGTSPCPTPSWHIHVIQNVSMPHPTLTLPCPTTRQKRFLRITHRRLMAWGGGGIPPPVSPQVMEILGAVGPSSFSMQNM